MVKSSVKLLDKDLSCAPSGVFRPPIYTTVFQRHPPLAGAMYYALDMSKEPRFVSVCNPQAVFPYRKYSLLFRLRQAPLTKIYPNLCGLQ